MEKEYIGFYPDYPIKSIKDVTDCEHKRAGFQGLYSLIGYYHCPDCKSKFCPQEFRRGLNNGAIFKN